MSECSLCSEPVHGRRFQNQAAIALEHVDKYQREVILHAADVQALTAVKEEFEKVKSQV